MGSSCHRYDLALTRLTCTTLMCALTLNEVSSARQGSRNWRCTTDQKINAGNMNIEQSLLSITDCTETNTAGRSNKNDGASYLKLSPSFCSFMPIQDSVISSLRLIIWSLRDMTSSRLDDTLKWLGPCYLH